MYHSTEQRERTTSVSEKSQEGGTTHKSERGKIFAQGIKHFSTHLQHILHKTTVPSLACFVLPTITIIVERSMRNGVERNLQNLQQLTFLFWLLDWMYIFHEFFPFPLFFLLSPSLDCVWFSGRDNSLNCVEFQKRAWLVCTDITACTSKFFSRECSVFFIKKRFDMLV